MALEFDRNDFSVSVVIPAYNAEQSIRQAIDSVLNQTLQPNEIIVVDDGSTDHTAEIAKSYPEISYVFQENGGVSAACNTGIKNVKNRWIAFIDSDDIWLPQKLELQISLLQRNPNLKWVMCNYYFNEHRLGRKLVSFDPSKAQQVMAGGDGFNFFEGVMVGLGWARSCMLIERNAIKEAGLFRSVYSAEDLDMCIRVAFIYPEIGYVILPQTEYHFRREGSLSSNSFVDLVKARCQNMEYLLELSEKYSKKAEFERVAGKLLVNWIRGLLEKGDEGRLLVRDISRRFGSLLSVKYKIELRLKIMLPSAGSLLFKTYFGLKRCLRISKEK